MKFNIQPKTDIDFTVIILQSSETTDDEKISAASILEERANDQLDSKSAFQLGVALLYSKSEMFNPEDGFRWLDLANQLGHPEARRMLNDYNSLVEMRKTLPLKVWSTFKYLFPDHNFSKWYLKDLFVMRALGR